MQESFDTNLLKIHPMVTEILSMSCFVLFLVTAVHGHLGVPNKSNWLHARTIVLQNWYDSTEIFFVSFLLFLVIEAILTGLFLFNFETTQCKNHFDLNLVKIHTALIEILSFSCFVLFLVMPDGGHLRMPNCKKIKMASSKKHSVTKLDEFQSWVLEILSFLCLQFMLFLVMAPGRHLG